MLANILRIATTGLLHAYSTRAIADHVYHDLAGWLMMPMALVMFGSELYILSKLFVEVEDVDIKPISNSKAEPKSSSRVSMSPLLIDVRPMPKSDPKKKPKPQQS